MVKFEEYIFQEHATIYDKLSDPNKDADGKGTQERYWEAVGKELDDFTQLIDNLPAATQVPATRINSMVGHAEADLGYHKDWIWFPHTSIDFRKNLVGAMKRLYRIRGRILCYQVMFKWLGFTAVITEDFAYLGGFDNPLVTLDSTLRRFDSYADTTVNYSIALTGSMTLPPFPSGGFPYSYPFGFMSTLDFINAIYTIILFNQAANLTLHAITYNGVDISNYFTLITNSKLRTNF